MTRKFSWPSSWPQRESCTSICAMPPTVDFPNDVRPIIRFRWPMPSTTVMWTTWSIVIWNRKIFCWPAVIKLNWLISDGRRTPNRINVKLCAVRWIICRQKCKFVEKYDGFVVESWWFEDGGRLLFRNSIPIRYSFSFLLMILNKSKIDTFYRII